MPPAVHTGRYDTCLERYWYARPPGRTCAWPAGLDSCFPGSDYARGFLSRARIVDSHLSLSHVRHCHIVGVGNGGLGGVEGSGPTRGGHGLVVITYG